ncbi:hypothetical protein DFQ27_005893 [Actinomortierella ambigua]|uniref:Uncharacterized protein n=1 Tax=Actinomortierella ambigua TaxID=1343610 RepID=A0A9P6PXU3_9FUNG|nr:hypothetical protein DFQ27_005893 [Actinomortierella ambigua]
MSAGPPSTCICGSDDDYGFMWKHVTVEHTVALRAHWNTHLYPRMMASHLYELNLLGEMPSRVMIDRLRLVDFKALRILRLEDCRVHTVYRLASTLSKLKVLVAKRIQPTSAITVHHRDYGPNDGGGDDDDDDGDDDEWDWRPFAGLHHLEELMLWRQRVDLAHHHPSRFFRLYTRRDRMNDTNDNEYVEEGEEGPSGQFALSPPQQQDGVLQQSANDQYPTMEGAGAWGGFVGPSMVVSAGTYHHASDGDDVNSNSSSNSSDEDNDDDGEGDDDGGSSLSGMAGANNNSSSSSSSHSSGIGPSTPSEASPMMAQLTAQFQSHACQQHGQVQGQGQGQGQGRRRQRQRRPFLGRLQRLALINIPSPTMHLGTDVWMRRMVSRARTYLYWQEHNVLFPVVKTDFSRLRHLVLVEACEPCWTGDAAGGGSSGAGRDHAQAFGAMQQLESLTLIHPAIRRPVLMPMLEALMQLPKLKTLYLAATEDMECIEMIVEYLLHQPLTCPSNTTTTGSPMTTTTTTLATTPSTMADTVLSATTERRWQGRVEIAIQDDLGAHPRRRDWRQKVLDRVYSGLDLKIDFFRSEWEDEDVGLRRLCLQAWERTRCQ